MVLVLFYGVNIYFAFALFRGLQAAAPAMNDSRAAQAGAAIGASFLLAMWAFAAVITGLLAMLTRGRRILVEDGLPAAPKVSFAKMAEPVSPDEFLNRAKAKRGFDTVQAVAVLGAGAIALIVGFAVVSWAIH